ncbi:MAG: Hsp20/alpha crystallin family protein [Halobacteriales archaeon]
MAPRDDPFEDIFEQMNEMMERMTANMGFGNLGPENGGFGGVRFTKKPGEDARVESFGDWGAGEADVAGSTAAGTTHVDVMEEEDHVRVVADLPGVSKQDIEVQLNGDVLHVSAESGDRSYDERARIDAEVDPDTAEASYNNGVLEVSFERLDDGDEGRTIQVD